MTHKKLFIVTLLLLTALIGLVSYGFLTGFTGCGTELYCLRRLFTSSTFTPFTLPITSLLLSVIPLFYLEERVYKIWQRFAVVAIPVVAILIFLAPTSAPGDYITLGYDREVASMVFSVLFVLTSWILIARSALKR